MEKTSAVSRRRSVRPFLLVEVTLVKFSYSLTLWTTKTSFLKSASNPSRNL